MTDPERQARLLELARPTARFYHDDNVDETGSHPAALHSGQCETCPHPDCVLVRSSLGATPEPRSLVGQPWAVLKASAIVAGVDEMPDGFLSERVTVSGEDLLALIRFYQGRPAPEAPQ